MVVIPVHLMVRNLFPRERHIMEKEIQVHRVVIEKRVEDETTACKHKTVDSYRLVNMDSVKVDVDRDVEGHAWFINDSDAFLPSEHEHDGTFHRAEVLPEYRTAWVGIGSSKFVTSHKTARELAIALLRQSLESYFQDLDDPQDFPSGWEGVDSYEVSLQFIRRVLSTLETYIESIDRVTATTDKLEDSDLQTVREVIEGFCERIAK